MSNGLTLEKSPEGPFHTAYALISGIERCPAPSIASNPYCQQPCMASRASAMHSDSGNDGAASAAFSKGVHLTAKREGVSNGRDGTLATEKLLSSSVTEDAE